MDNHDLLDLLKDDDLGLLDISKRPSSITPDERLVSSFLEINDFYKKHDLEPKVGGDIYEHKLASRLNHIRENNALNGLLSEYDIYGLLKTKAKNFETVSDIFEDDNLDLLSIEDSSLFQLTHVPNNQQRKNAEFIATRKPCKDFENFEGLFLQCHSNLKMGTYKLLNLEKHSQIQTGAFFVLGGVLGYIQSSEDLEINDQGKINGRLRVIFENGTESNMLLQSLVRSLQKEGGKLVAIDENKKPEAINASDKETGYIYVLKSLSENPQIATVKNLFKIGFSTTSVEQRISNAEQDPTYLMAPVKIVSTYKCFNMNPQRFERLLHRFFESSCLDVEITDKMGNKYIPKEWFIAPVTVIEKSIELIISGEIINYHYDKTNGSIVNSN
jgi:hypothetical protein